MLLVNMYSLKSSLLKAFKNIFLSTSISFNTEGNIALVDIMILTLSSAAIVDITSFTKSILESCMSSKECNKLVSDVKLGIDLGIIKNVPPEKINQLSIYTKPASLQKYLGEVLTEEERDIKRCEIIGKILK